MGDLKPIDVFLASLKPGESWVEERTVVICNRSEELGIGVKVQSRWAIAGSARDYS